MRSDQDRAHAAGVAATASGEAGAPAAMTHREVLEALSGLLLGMFVALLASTVVSSSLPRIITDLGGTQASFTWVITSTLLAMTVSTPIWGKLSDLVDRKLLVQSSLGIFVVASLLAAVAQNPGELIAARGLQGLGAGGLTALVQVVLSDIISPRERGRYMGLLGAVTALPTIAGPLIGGLITDSIGWRYNFFVGIPFALAAIVLLRRTLHLPRRRRKVTLDVAGTVFLTSGISLLLIWVSLAGQQYAWGSPTSYALVIGAVVLLAAAVAAEFRAKEPLISPALFGNRTLTLAVLASMAIGIVLFGTSVFLSQYMQLARGNSPTASGLLTIPMVAGTLVSSIVVGRIITRTGVWKRYVVGGTVLTALGALGMGTVRYDTSLVLVSAFMFLIGLGVGSVMQNMVLLVQNTVSVGEVGAASSTVSFFRTLGGAIGVSVLGAILGSRVSTLIADGLASAGITLPSGPGSSTLPDLSTLPGPVRLVIQASYGEAIGDIFLLAAPIMLIAIVATVLMPNVPLGERSGIELDDGEGDALKPADVLGTGSETLHADPSASLRSEADRSVGAPGR